MNPCCLDILQSALQNTHQSVTVKTQQGIAVGPHRAVSAMINCGGHGRYLGDVAQSG